LVGSVWELVGPPGFSTVLASDITLAFNGSTPYVAFGGYRNQVMKLNGRGDNWELVGDDLPGHSSGTNKSLAFAGSVPYMLFKKTSNYNTVATVVKLNDAGTTWETVGPTEFPVSMTTVLLIKD